MGTNAAHVRFLQMGTNAAHVAEMIRTSETEQKKKEVQSHVFEVVIFRSRLVC